MALHDCAGIKTHFDSWQLGAGEDRGQRGRRELRQRARHVHAGRRHGGVQVPRASVPVCRC